MLSKAFWSVAVAALAAGVMVVVTADAAHAGCGAAAGFGDGKIRSGSDPYLGADIYGCNGSGQTVVRITGPGEKEKFDAKYKNDSGVTADIRVAGGVSGVGDLAHFKATILRPDKGNKDVTDKVLGSGVVYKDVPAGTSTPRLHIVIKSKSSVEVGDGFLVGLGGRIDANNPDTADVVRASADTTP